jgi:hypothetical protein
MAHADASAAMNVGGRLQRAEHRLEGASQIDPVEAEGDFDHPARWLEYGLPCVERRRLRRLRRA